MNLQINNGPCPDWQSLPNEIYVSIFKRLSCIELKTISAVSKLWEEIANSDLFFRDALKETLSSVEDLLRNPRTPQIFYLLENSRFGFHSRSLSELTYECFKSKVRPFNLAVGLDKLMLELATNCELGTPKIHFWKPLPPHTFTIAVGLYITKIGQSYPKKEMNEISISYIDPHETDSLSKRSESQSFPPYWSSTGIKDKYSYSVFAYFWCGNLNAISAQTISHNCSHAFSSGVTKILENF